MAQQKDGDRRAAKRRSDEPAWRRRTQAARRPRGKAAPAANKR